MTEERRTAARVWLNLPAHYDGLSGANEARVEDISMSGCFVNTQGQVNIGDIIVVELSLPEGERLRLGGQVTTHQPGVGFGMVFSALTDETQETLRKLLKL